MQARNNLPNFMSYNLIKLAFHSVHVDLRKVNSAYEGKTVWDIVVRFFRSIFSGKVYMPKRHRQTHIFFFATQNQYAALENVRNRLSDKSLTYYHGNDVVMNSTYSTKYPFWMVYLISLFTFLKYYSLILKLERKFKAINPRLGYRYLLSLYFGHYFFDIFLLKIHKPRYLWMSNDHTYLNVAFLYAAKKLGVTTIYLQHASVSPLFPPLAFDYAFLDGEVAFQTYKNIGIKGTNVFLSGISKMDGYIGKQSTGKISSVLICINHWDDISVFQTLINELVEMKYSVKIRKHPYMTSVLNNESIVEISREKVFMDSLNDIDLLIAGDSNVHLEATLTNIPCFYLSTSKLFDYYGFLQNGLVVWGGRDLEDCLKQVRDYKVEEDVYLRAKPYCASVGTEFENKSTSFVLDKLGINDS